MSPAKKQSFEDAVRRLEEIVERLESGATPLEQSFALFEEGMKLAADCQKQLEQMRGRVEVLVRTKDGHRCEPLDSSGPADAGAENAGEDDDDDAF